MTVPARNPNVVALFPLQETIWDKDGTGPLASGVVSFFSDPDFSIPKDVYQESDDPVTGDVSYANLGNVLILSGIGSFIDGNGENFIPLLYPYIGSPSDSVVGAFEPYYITVYSSVGVFQFSSNDWPPNSFSQSSSSSAQEALSPNLITNPQFSVISFTPAPSTGSYVYSVSGNESNVLAPGWTLDTSGTGTVTVTQESLSTTIPSQSPYSLQVAWSTGLSSLKIVQKLTNSPRILADGYASASLVVSSPTGDTVSIEVHYVAPAPNAQDVLLVSGTSTGTNTYTTIDGTAAIPATNTQSSAGYVNFEINITSLASASSVQITSAQMVAVSALDIKPPYIQQTTQENLNNLMWYYEPQLAYKPIPSYTIGWDFPFNPCQALGKTVGVSGLGNNLSRYIADQTIAFEAVGNSLSYVINNTAGLVASTTNATQFAYIQYLDSVTASELLRGNMCVKLNAATGTALTGYVNLYFTQDASLPTVSAGTNQSLIATMTNGQPATFNGTWTRITRPSLADTNATIGTAVFEVPGNNMQTDFMLSGWNGQALPGVGSATFFCYCCKFRTNKRRTSINTDILYISER